MITAAILGGGFMAASHAASYRELGDRVRVKTVCARTSQHALRVAESVGAEVSVDLANTLTDPEIDIINICLPTDLHREAAERALAAGKHVLLEKPIALTLEDADAILTAAEESNRVFMVGLTLRFWPEYAELAQRLAADELGRALSVSTYRLSPPADWNDWMADPKRSGGVPVDLLVHDFDQMNQLLGRPQRVFARPVQGAGKLPPGVLCLVEYENGEGVAEGSMMMPDSYTFSSNIRVLCEGGVAEYSLSAASAQDEGNIGTEALGTQGLRFFRPGAAPETVPVKSANPWNLEIAYFVECVERGKEPEHGTGAQAREALRVALAVNRSLASGYQEEVGSRE